MIKHMFCLVFCLALQLAPAKAEKLTFKLSNQIVALTPNYTGTQLAVFGAVEKDSKRRSKADQYDIIITVTGPSKRAFIREKSNLGPIWVTSEERRVYSFPAYASVLSSRPLEDITTPAVRSHLKLGFDQMIKYMELVGGQGANEEKFKKELFRLALKENLWTQDPQGIKFFGQNLFHGSIFLSSSAPSGAYLVEGILLADGLPIARDSQIFQLEKVGIEAKIDKVATRWPLFYGLVVAFMAITMGWLGWALFKRD